LRLSRTMETGLRSPALIDDESLRCSPRISLIAL
jgi:hypothetical protein